MLPNSIFYHITDSYQIFECVQKDEVRFVVPVAFLRARLKHFLHINILYSMLLKQIFVMDTTEKLVFSPPIKKCVFIFFGPFTPREFLSRWFQWRIQRNGSSVDTKWGCKRVNIWRYRNLKWWRFCHEFCDFGCFKEI